MTSTSVTISCLFSFRALGTLHDLSGYSREEVVVEFTDLDAAGLRTPIPLWMERNKDHIPWVREEYERVKAGVLTPAGGDIKPPPK